MSGLVNAIGDTIKRIRKNSLEKANRKISYSYNRVQLGLPTAQKKDEFGFFVNRLKSSSKHIIIHIFNNCKHKHHSNC